MFRQAPETQRCEKSLPRETSHGHAPKDIEKISSFDRIRSL
jgi:hypothetical protein